MSLLTEDIMLQLAEQETHTPTHDRNARAYILAMKAGQKPGERPDVGPAWAGLVEMIERAYSKSQGDTVVMERTIETLSKKYPNLVDLLTIVDLPTKPSTIEHLQELGIPTLPQWAQLPQEVSQGAFPTLDIYIPFSKQASPEGYEDFHPFGWIWDCSVVAGRRIYLPQGVKEICTNLYLLFCAKTSTWAKSTTAEVALYTLRQAGFEHMLAPDRATPQHLLSSMSGAWLPAHYDDVDIEEQEEIERSLAMPGQRGLYFDEFGKTIAEMLSKSGNMAAYVQILLEFDMCKQKYSNATITRSVEPIKKPYLTLFSAASIASLKNSAKAGGDFWTDGFWARFSFICAPKDGFIDAPLSFGRLPVPSELTRALRKWNDRLGVPEITIETKKNAKGEEIPGKYVIRREELPAHECSIDQEAAQAWVRYRSALKELMRTFDDEDLNGNYDRLPDKAIRIAVIIASLENNNRIELRHWAKAQELAEILRRNLHELYSQVNSNTPSALARETAKLEDEILKGMHHLLTRTDKKQYEEVTAGTIRSEIWSLRSYARQTLDDILRGLVRAGSVEMTRKVGSSSYYKLTLAERGRIEAPHASEGLLRRI